MLTHPRSSVHHPAPPLQLDPRSLDEVLRARHEASQHARELQDVRSQLKRQTAELTRLRERSDAALHEQGKRVTQLSQLCQHHVERINELQLELDESSSSAQELAQQLHTVQAQLFSAEAQLERFKQEQTQRSSMEAVLAGVRHEVCRVLCFSPPPSPLIRGHHAGFRVARSRCQGTCASGPC